MSAYGATQLFGGPSALDAGPGWCFERFGQTTTVLDDGRQILIAGEHEDHYDPDFFIYNDVVVIAPGGEIAIYGYPKEVFPPTDFHSATLLPGRIVLIGSLGYQEERVNKTETQVLQLTLDNFEIHTTDPSGPSPGWIHGHTAFLSDDGQSIVISGGKIDPGCAGRSYKESLDDWALDIRSWRWRRRTTRDWQQWAFLRVDRRPSQLWHLRQAVWARDMARHAPARWQGRLMEDMERLEASIGRTPDLDVIPSLYRLDDSVTELAREEDPHNVFRVLIDGMSVRFTEQSFLVHAIVEGRLSQERLQGLQESVLEKLSKLEGVEWEIETL
jgi:hypothetical protein